MCVCARSFSGFPGEHKITQEREEESQLMFVYFGWLSFGEESSRILLCEKIVKLLSVNTCSCFFFFSSEILRQFLPDECKTRFGGLIGPECSF